MPNWCLNELKVRGEAETITFFIEKARGEGTDFSLDSFWPMPKELLNYSSPPRMEKGETEEEFRLRVERLRNRYGAKDWYDWAIGNWGTKWDVVAQGKRTRDEEVDYYFDSAWAPPINGLVKISRQYPDLEFELFYFEPGMCFGGVAVVKNGEVYDRYYESKEAVEWLRAYRPDLWENFYGKEECDEEVQIDIDRPVEE